MKKAKFDLRTEVYPLIESERYDFISPSRSIDCVMKVFPNKDIGAARTYILAAILALSPSDFADSLYESDWKIIWDIYGKRIDGINWYIKFFIEKDENDQDYLAEVSFHPLEKDLKLNSEVVLRKEES